ncbi:MAG: aminotransferase class I/II-fold pyridoxal phosphate-dependent enzyme [Patescibacteria group bacterium]
MISKTFQRWRPISISLSPNTEQDDVWLAFQLLFQPWRWRESVPHEQSAANILEEECKKYFGARHAISFNSARSALMAILYALGLEKGSEVLLQAFTCNAVPNPVIWSGLKPVYVDCREDDFNIDGEDLESKITPSGRAVIVQHTFGLPADLDKIREICRKHNLLLIEDCAHALGAKYRGRVVGTWGKAAFLSFSRDKVISSVYGGMAVTNDDALAEKIKEFQEKAGYPSLFWIFQQLLHPVLMNWKILPTYRILGKYLLVVAQQLHLLSKAVHWKEKRGMKPAYFPRRMPNALALLALKQFQKLDRLNEHRKEVARYYTQALQATSFELPKHFEEREHIFLRFPLKHPRAHAIIKNAWSNNVLIGDWYTSPIAPADTQMEKIGYVGGSCPTAERLSKVVLNLPTHINISKKEMEQILATMVEFAREKENGKASRAS